MVVNMLTHLYTVLDHVKSLYTVSLNCIVIYGFYAHDKLYSQNKYLIMY